MSPISKKTPFSRPSTIRQSVIIWYISFIPSRQNKMLDDETLDFRAIVMSIFKMYGHILTTENDQVIMCFILVTFRNNFTERVKEEGRKSAIVTEREWNFTTVLCPYTFLPEWHRQLFLYNDGCLIIKTFHKLMLLTVHLLIWLTDP